jgi:hypothetical protein
MGEQPALELAPLFADVEQVLRLNREALNQADSANGNHGDHMIDIFCLATSAAAEKESAPLADAMEYAAGRLEQLDGNGSARVYAHGLAQLAAHFCKHNLDLDDFVGYVRSVLRDSKIESARSEDEHNKDVLKALLGALYSWRLVESGRHPLDNSLDLSFLFDLGVAYMQAKQRGAASGASRAQVLADAAASVSPLSGVPHRSQSGRLAIQALLEAMQQG